jgi:hypothetical protein
MRESSVRLTLVSTRLYIYVLAPIHCADLEERKLLHRIWRHQSSVVLEEKRRGDLWHFAHYLTAFLCFLGFDFAFRYVFLEARVILADKALYLEEGSVLRDLKNRKRAYGAEFAGLFCSSHLELSFQSASVGGWDLTQELLVFREVEETCGSLNFSSPKSHSAGR